jgi:two-component system, NarL family, response regulator DevR
MGNQGEKVNVMNGKLADDGEETVKVFIADDSLIVRERLVEMCRNLEYAEIVGQAQSVPEAINGIENLNPEVVILDAQMPGGNGIDVVHHLSHGSAKPLIIMMTNYAYSAFRQKCLAVGADHFLDKSRDFDQLPALLRRYQVSKTATW